MAHICGLCLDFASVNFKCILLLDMGKSELSVTSVPAEHGLHGENEFIKSGIIVRQPFYFPRSCSFITAGCAAETGQRLEYIMAGIG